MRIKRVIGAGVAGLLWTADVSVAQFAGERQPPQLPPGLRPAAPVAYQPQPGPVVRANYPATQAMDEAPHGWAVKPENGAWMILVKGYVGADSKKLAEQLCREIRDTHKVAAYLFERNAVERKREQELQEAIRRKAEEDARPFLQTIEQQKKKAEAEGSVFIPSAPRIKVPKPLNPLPEQWAVMIGGFPDGDTARKALDTVRKFPHPKDPALMQEAFITRPTQNGGTKIEQAYINPYAAALVVPNPSLPAGAGEDRTKLEPFIVKMNQDVPHSLLTARKPWTLMVKSFTTPMKLTGKDGDGDGSVFDRGGLFGGGKKSMLDLTAAQASQLCEALRHKDMKPAPLEAFILHHRTGSLVTVGQFDAPDDPELLKLQATLKGMTFKMMNEKTRMTTTERMFDSVSPFPVPHQ
jgi:hypothetical protein